MPSYEEGTFTATATGFSGTAPSGTARYVRVGKQVTLRLPVLSGTSNASSLTITGVPAGLAAVAGDTFYVVLLQDNGAFQTGLLVLNGTTLILYATPGFAGFTPSGAKGLFGTVLTWLLA